MRTVTTRRMPARGYLLMEAMVGGAMAGVVMMGMLTLVAVSRAKNIAAARDITANQLVTEMLEQTRAASSPPLGTFPPVATAATVVASAGGVYTRSSTVNATGCPEVRTNPGPGPAISVDCRNVTVTVTYTSMSTTRTTQAAMRVYQE